MYSDITKFLKNKITISNMISDKNTNTLISSFDIVAAFPNKKSFKPDWFPLVELEIKERSTDPIAKKKVGNEWVEIDPLPLFDTNFNSATHQPTGSKTNCN